MGVSKAYQITNGQKVRKPAVAHRDVGFGFEIAKKAPRNHASRYGYVDQTASPDIHHNHDRKERLELEACRIHLESE